MAKTRVAMVGAGAVAQRHVGVLTGFEDVELVGVTDVVADAAQALAATAGCAAFPDLERLLDETAPDAVYVCVPPFAHGRLELTLIEHAIPFFVEKPLACDLAIAEEVAAGVEERGLVTATGYHWRYLAVVETARSLLAATPPRMVVAAWLDKVPPPAWWTRRDLSGGQMIEQATHVLDVMLDLIGDVEHVYAIGSRAPRSAFPDADIDDVGVAALRFANGAVGSIASTSLLRGKHRAGIEVFADGRRFELSETELVVDDGDGPVVHADPGDAKRRVDRAFIDAVQGRPGDVRAPYAVALRTHRLACAIARSAEKRTPRDLATVVRTRALGIRAPGEPAIVDVPLEPVGAGHFVCETLYSGISAGTELTYLKGTNPYLHATWDAELGVFRRDVAGTGYPVHRLGYMEVARVVESRAPGVPDGALVAMTYGHRERHVADAGAERHVLLPDDIEPILGIYAAHMGPICANGLLHAAAEVTRGDVRRLGDGVEGLQVLVFGAGVVGLLTALLAARHGAAEVALVDRSPRRLATAAALGFMTIDEAADAPWRTVKGRWRHGAQDRGADVVFQCRGQDAALSEALRCLRPQGTVIDLAFYPAGAPDLRLGEEFHHNGLTIRCAQIGRVPRGLGHLWDRERLSRETLALLRADGDALRRHVISDVVPFEEGPTLLRDVAARRREVIQAVLAF